MATPDEDLVDYLNTQVGALTKGTNLFYGPPRAVSSACPDQVVFCLATGGAAPAEFVSGGSGAEEREHSVLVRVRSNADAFDAGQTLARTVSAAAHRASVSGYTDVFVRETDPAYLGVNNKGNHEWSIGVTMEDEW